MAATSAEIVVKATEVPEMRALFRAAHVLLVRRLKGELDTKEGLIAWNELITAHDAIAEGRDQSVTKTRRSDA
jgi:hypothetical protein